MSLANRHILLGVRGGIAAYKCLDLIRRLQHRIAVPLSGRGSGCVVGIGDDGAVLESPPGRQLVVCTDTLNEGVHFPLNTTPRAIGHKALAVNLSDLAAMGAEPAWAMLSVSLPGPDEGWLAGFAAGLGELAARHGVDVVVGQDTCVGRSGNDDRSGG